MNILKAGYGKRVKRKTKQIYLSVGLLLGLIFSAVFSNETMAYAAEWTSGISYAYNPYNNSLLGLNLNGNSVIIVESDTEGEFNLYLDSDKDGVIDTDEKMLGIQNGPDTAVTSFPETFYLYGVYNTTLDDSIFITMKSGSVGGIYGVYSSDSTYNAAIHGSVSITMKDGELNNIYGVYNSSVSSESGDAVSINVLGGVVKYDITGSSSSDVVAPKGYNAININVTDDAILRYGVYGINGQKRSTTEENAYGITGNVTVSTIGGTELGRTSNPNIRVIQNALVDGNLSFQHIGGDIDNLSLVKGTLNGSVVANMETDETASVALLDYATIEGDVTINQKATVNTSSYVIADNCNINGNVNAKVYGGLKEDVFSYHYHLFVDTQVSGNLDLLVSGGNIDCIHAFNDGTIGGYANITVENVKNPDKGYVSEDILSGVTVTKDISVDIINSEFTGLMVLAGVTCGGDADVNITNSMCRNSLYATFKNTTINGNFVCSYDNVNVVEYIYGLTGAIVVKDAKYTFKDCTTNTLYVTDYGTVVNDLYFDVINCNASILDVFKQSKVQGNTYLKIDGGNYGIESTTDTLPSHTIMIDSSTTNNVYLTLSEVTFNETNRLYFSSDSDIVLDIKDCTLGKYLSICGSEDTLTSNKIMIANSTINDAYFSYVPIYVADGSPLSIDGKLEASNIVNFILEDEFNVESTEKYTGCNLNIYFNGGDTNITAEDINNTYYAIAVDNFKNKAKVSGGDAITLSNIADRFFVKPGNVAELTVTPLTGVEISSLSAKAGSTDMTEEITYDKGICSFTMPEAVVTLDAVLAEKKEEEHKHTFDTQWSTDETHHWYKCTDAACSEQKDKAEHTFDEGIVEKEASSTEAGVKKYTCTVCGYAKTEAIVATGVETLKVGTKITDKNSKATFEVSKAGLEVTYVKPTNSNAKTVTIPATIKKDGVTYKVTNIANKAFSGCKKLKKVTIGKNVKTIGSQAFYKCTSLKSITIPANVTKIGKKAFYGCKSLKTITFKTTKLTSKKVGSKAFTGTHSKAKVNVPKKKYKAYKKMLKSKGMSKKAVYKKK